MARFAWVVVTVVLLSATGATGSERKPDGPIWIATGYGSVWVGTGGGSVIRIDPHRHRVVQHLDLSVTAVQGLAAAYGSVWVATGTGLLQRIDAATGRVRGIWTPDTCTARSVAVAAGALWVLDFHRKRLCRIDPVRKRVSRRVWIDAGEPLTLWSGSARLWLSVNLDPKPPLVGDQLEHVRLLALDPQTGAPLGPTIDTAGWVAFSSGFGSLWAADPVASTLMRIDPISGRATALRSGVESTAAPVAGFRALWLPVGRTLWRLDPDSLGVVAEVPVAATSVAVGAGGVWVLNTGDGTPGTVYEVDPRTNRVVGRPIPLGR